MWMIDTAIGLGIALALVALYLLSCIRVLNEYQRGVIGIETEELLAADFDAGSRLPPASRWVKSRPRRQ